MGRGTFWRGNTLWGGEVRRCVSKLWIPLYPPRASLKGGGHAQRGPGREKYHATALGLAELLGLAAKIPEIPEVRRGGVRVGYGVGVWGGGSWGVRGGDRCPWPQCVGCPVSAKGPAMDPL